MPPSKSNSLREEGALNPHPEAVNDPKFKHGEFFDPDDLVQVKYEMLRRAQSDHVSVTQAAEEYGFSRPTFYQARTNFESAGVAGLVQKKRGPRGPHKLRGVVLDYAAGLIVPGKPIRARAIAEKIREQFGVDIHPRTIERALSSSKKNAG